MIHYSAEGFQQISIAFGNHCTEIGVRPSMFNSGNDYDNAVAQGLSSASNANALGAASAAKQAFLDLAAHPLDLPTAG